LSENQFTGQIDVRGSVILDVSADQVIVAQTDPPILKSMTGREVEASLVHRNVASGDTRWSWAAIIESQSHGYRLNPNDPNSSLVSVIFLSRPGKPVLEKRNIRQAYRFEVGLRDGITVRLDPALAPVNLLNFSVGGMMLSTPIPPAYTFGQELGFELSFPDYVELPEKYIQGRASIVRLEFEPGDKFVQLGLKFQNLSRDGLKVMHRIINYYMLAEQRSRNRIGD
jgi:c-di-GMP-binding flagellar brake protein YcgR